MSNFFLSIVQRLNDDSADLWELPQSQLTSAITEKTEKNFYSRCPPEKRPRFMNKETQNVSPTISQSSLSKDTARNTENDKKGYEPDMEKVCRGRIARLSQI